MRHEPPSGGFRKLLLVLSFSCSLGSVTVLIDVKPETPYEGTKALFNCRIDGLPGVGELKLHAKHAAEGTDNSLVCYSPGFVMSDNFTLLSPRSTVFGCRTPIYNVTIVLNITLQSELYYFCSTTYLSDKKAVKAYSKRIFLPVKVAPEETTIYPEELVFNEGDNVQINCSAFGGRPTAELWFSITSNDMSSYSYTQGQEFVSLSLKASREHHFAAVTCSASNHLLLSSNTSKRMLVNYIYAKESIVRIQVQVNGTIVNCSFYVMSYPSALYFWSVPKEFTSTRGPVYPINTEEVGLSFVCIATNSVTSSSVSIMFLTTENSTLQSISTKTTSSEHGIVLTAATIVASTVILTVVTVPLIVFRRRLCHRRIVKHQEARISETANNPSKPGSRGSIFNEEHHAYEDIDDYSMTGRELELIGQPTTTSEKRHYMFLQQTTEYSGSCNPHAYSQLEEKRLLDIRVNTSFLKTQDIAAENDQRP